MRKNQHIKHLQEQKLEEQMRDLKFQPEMNLNS